VIPAAGLGTRLLSVTTCLGQGVLVTFVLILGVILEAVRLFSPPVDKVQLGRRFDHQRTGRSLWSLPLLED
jgi:hypothetical protein